MSFKDIQINRKYHTSKEDIVQSFYTPVLSESTRYLRAVGYFSSHIMVEYIVGLETFVNNSGKMYLIISPSISIEDAITLLESVNPKITFTEQLSSLFISYSKCKKTEYAAKILFSLIKEGYLEVKIAEPKNATGIFHEKIGIFRDKDDNRIAINGSNNETGNALKYNVESFNTFCSWKNGQDEYVIEHEMDFNTYWSGHSDDINVHNLLDALSHDIIRIYDTDESITSMYEKLRQEVIESRSTLNFTPRDFQQQDAERWLEAKRGIISYATGVGKTKTAIYAISLYFKKFKRAFVLVSVPDKSLVNQWSEELKNNGFQCLLCYSDSPAWKPELKNVIDQWNYKTIDSAFVITTNQTFAGSSFQNQIKRIKSDYIFLSDECHHLGTENLLSKLPEVEYRLGLSATPEIYMQESRTDRLMNYFQGVLAEYSISKAIENGYLVPYEYHPICVELTDDEKTQYDKLTSQIVKLIGCNDEREVRNAEEALELLLFKRARIIYCAANKLSKLEDMLDEMIGEGYFLVYCGASGASQEVEDDTTNVALSQLQSVNQILSKRKIAAAQYTQEEGHIERLMELDAFRAGSLKCLVAIKCLDEGIDIPEVRKAIILASSGNPREYVQRRGRLLRIAPGKSESKIYDMVVFSPTDSYASINKVELKRLKEFASISINADEIMTEYNEYFKKYLDNEETEGSNNE